VISCTRAAGLAFIPRVAASALSRVRSFSDCKYAVIEDARGATIRFAAVDECVNRSDVHGFASKDVLAGSVVLGDCHAGKLLG